MQFANARDCLSFCEFQYRKRYGLHAINHLRPEERAAQAFQYRKRYGLHAINTPRTASHWTWRFQYRKRYGLHAIDCFRHIHRRCFSFQYRKRYGLHAIKLDSDVRRQAVGFQYRKRYGLHAILVCVTAVYENGCFNTASGMDCMQYCLPEALETVSPKTEFLTMTPFSRFFPK